MNPLYLSEAQELEKLWGETKLLEGIDDKYTRAATVCLLETQRLFNESATDTSDIARFKRISIPLIRRVYPHLIANKLVSVQPLLGPTGLVYYLRFRYASDRGDVRGGNTAGFPTDDHLSLQQRASGDANLNIWYAHSYVQNETQTNAGGGTELTYILEKVPVIAGTITGSVYDGDTLVQHFNVNESGTFTLTDVGTPTNKVSSASIDTNTGLVTLTWNNDPGANSIVASYEQNMECQQDLPEINMTIENESVEAKTRKLRATWSYEVQQDVRSQFNIDAEAEITGNLASEMNLEIDREILTDLRFNAGTVSAWDYSTALGDTIKEKYESLYVKVAQLANTIHRKTLRGMANWIVCSPEVATIFETATAGFAPQPSETFTSSIGMQYVGTAAGRFKLYKDPLFPNNQLLMGYKGDSPWDAGYFYLPYVPLIQTPVVYDPESFCPRRGLFTRYGKKLLRDGAKFYGRLTIAGFNV